MQAGKPHYPVEQCLVAYFLNNTSLRFLPFSLGLILLSSSTSLERVFHDLPEVIAKFDLDFGP
jgi:hypothetical protein